MARETPSIPPVGQNEIQTSCDLLCIGGGLGGLAGALRAHDRGLEAVIIEKSDWFGGVAAYSGGAVWVGVNHLQQAEGYHDSFEEAAQYLDYLGGDGVNIPYDRELRQALLQAAPQAIRWYSEAAGVPFAIIGLPDQYYPTAPGSKAGGRELEVSLPGTDLGAWQPYLRRGPYHPGGLTHREVLENGGAYEAQRRQAALLAERQASDFLSQGRGLVGGFARAALVERKIPLHLGVRAIELIQEDGRILGAVVSRNGQNTAVKARKGVLIATGSYGSAEYAATMEGLPAIKEQAPPVLDGDALDLTDPTPAALVRASQTFITVGYQSRKVTHQGTDAPVYFPIYTSLALPHIIAVNEEGKRFGDETFYGTFSESLRAFDPFAKRFVNYPCFAIMDDQYRRRYPLGAETQWPAESIETANDLGGLAAKLGINPTGLEETVQRYNNDAAGGVDHQFGRGQTAFASAVLGDRTYRNPTMGPIVEPPFWGVRLEILGAGIYSHGLHIDAGARVLTRAGKPVPGLYATGNAVAYTEVLYGYESGLANARNITYAYLAADSAAAS